MRFLLLPFVTLLFAGTAVAGPKASPGSEGLCKGYEETIEGVWKDASGAEALLFRFASNADGRGCYAWLNDVPQWSIGSPGSDRGDNFTRDGAKRAWSWKRGKDGVYVDLQAGTARFVRNGRTTKGEVFRQ